MIKNIKQSGVISILIFFLMFIMTACVIFLIKLRLLKTKRYCVYKLFVPKGMGNMHKDLEERSFSRWITVLRVARLEV